MSEANPIPELSDSESGSINPDEGKSASEIMSPQMKNLIEMAKRHNDSLAHPIVKKEIK